MILLLERVYLKTGKKKKKKEKEKEDKFAKINDFVRRTLILPKTKKQILQEEEQK